MDQILRSRSPPVTNFTSQVQSGNNIFGSLVECLKSDDAKIADKFEYALKELSGPIKSVLIPAFANVGVHDAGDRAILGDTKAYFLADVVKVVGLTARSCGGIIGQDAELFLRIMARIWPARFRNISAVEAMGFIESQTEDDSESAVRVPMTLIALRQYDLAHGTQEAVKLASLFGVLVLEVSELHPESLAKTLAVGTYLAVFGKFMPKDENDDVAPEEQSSTSSSDNESSSASHSLEADCSTLGISPHFTIEELRSAYLSKAKEWHPDRLEGMAPELKDYANRQLTQISAAYVRLKGAKTEVL